MQVRDARSRDCQLERRVALLPAERVADDPAHALLEGRDLRVVPTHTLGEQDSHVALLESADQLLKDDAVVDALAGVVLGPLDRERAGALN